METPMAADDRSFEKALARHLRSEPVAQGSDCADAETLAAYHERLLAPHEVSSWKGHIAGFGRCQEVLAQLEATDEIPVATITEKERDSRLVVMPAAAQPVALQAATPALRHASTAAAHESEERRVSFIRGWRMLVPAGALAAGLLV